MQKLLLFLFSPFITLAAFSQSLIMAKQFHGNDSQTATTAAFDAEGNTYTLCNFWDDLDADPGPDVLNFNVVASMDMAIIKLNAAGDLVWAKQIGGTGFDGGYKILTDADGEVFIFGYFNGTIDMDPGVGTYNLITSGGDEVFCGKYDSNGDFLWAAKFGGTGTEQAYGFALNAAGNAFIHGYFQSTIDFNPGPGTFNLTAGPSGSNFLVELDNDGLFQTAILMSSAYGNSMIIDPYDNIYITGLFWGTVDFDPGPGTFNLVASGFGADAFLLKLDPDNDFLWAGKFSGSDDEQGVALSYDNLNDAIVIGGFFQGTMDANPGGGTSNIVSGGYVDGFIIKLNDDGTFVWGKGISGLGFQQIIGLAVDVSGNIHSTGPFEQTTDFDPSGTTYNLTSSGYTDIFRMVWTADGNFSAAERIGGTSSDWPSAMQLDNSGAEVITGYFENIVDFDPGAGTFNLDAAFTGRDGFLSSYCTTYNISLDVAICEGESYFAGGAFQTDPGDYYDYFDPVEGCDSIVVTHLSVNNPTVNLGPDDGFCAGDALILDAENTGADYDWNTGATTQTINVTESGTYSVIVTDNAGCTAEDEIVIEIFPSPIVNLGPDISVCAGDIVVLDAENPGDNYVWNTGATTQTISVTTSGNYGVTVTNDAGCSDIDIVHVTVNANPVVDIGDEIEFCENESVMLDAENIGALFLWSTGATTQQITTNAPGIYSVEVTNVAGCIASDEVELIALPAPIVDLGADISICDGETVLLDAGNPGDIYNWNTGAETQTISVTESDTYTVVVTNDFGCSENDLVIVTVHPTPVVELGTTIEFCENVEIILDAENPGADYEWTTGEITQTIIITSSGTYGVTVTNDFGCSDDDEIIATTLPAPTVDLGSDTAFCDGSSITLDATTPSCTYGWNTDENTPTIQVTVGGIYSVVVTNDFGCTDTDAIFVEIYPAPLVEFELAENSICLDADPVTLTEGTPAGGIYSGTGISGDIFDPAVAGIGIFSITYTYTDAQGCSAAISDEIEVTVCQAIHDNETEYGLNVYPNPTNGFVSIDLTQISGDYSIRVIDVSGRICYQTNSVSTQSIIQYNLSMLPSGSYLIELTDGKMNYISPLVISK